jgi:hypothetical protein
MRQLPPQGSGTGVGGEITMKCVQLSSCPFYNDKMPMESGLGAIYKKKYCMDNNAICARYVIFKTLGGGYVPDTLYPGMLDVARQILASAGKIAVSE